MTATDRPDGADPAPTATALDLTIEGDRGPDGDPAIATDLPAVEPTWPSDDVGRPLREPTPLAARWLVAGAAAGVAADLALRRPPLTNVAGAILVAVLAAGLLASGFLRTRTSRLLAVGAAFFGLFLAIRTDPTLLAFDLLAAGGLLVLAAVHGQGRSFWELRPLRLVADGAAVVGEAVEGLIEVPAEIGARWRVARDRAAAGESQTAWALLRGVAITVPIVLVLGLLLASADAVFSSFFSGFAFDVPALIGHLMLMAVGAYALLVLLRIASTQGSRSAPRHGRTLGAIETGVLLVSINVLFASFAVAQLMTVLGGADAALERAGLDPKQFARQGFFQLLWVAGLTLGLLMVVHVLTAEHVGSRRITRSLTPVTVVLTILIVAVAVTRIRYYIDDGGLTPLRLYAAVFALWVAVAFAITAVRIQGWRANRAWLLPALLVSGLTILAGLNLVGIERLIAEDNLALNDPSLPFHVQAGQFSGQGEVVLIEGLDRLDPELAELVRTELCRDHAARSTSSGWLDANVGHRRAQAALEAGCAAGTP